MLLSPATSAFCSGPCPGSFSGSSLGTLCHMMGQHSTFIGPGFTIPAAFRHNRPKCCHSGCRLEADGSGVRGLREEQARRQSRGPRDSLQEWRERTRRKTGWEWNGQDRLADWVWGVRESEEDGVTQTSGSATSWEWVQSRGETRTERMGPQGTQ